MTSIQNGPVSGSIPTPQIRPQARPENLNNSQAYTVKAGDSLWKIAESQYGDGMKWTDIYANNKDLIGKNPDLIQPGMQLNLKGLAEAPSEPVTEATAPTPSETSLNDINLPESGSATPTVELFVEEPAPMFESVEPAPVMESTQPAPMFESVEPAPVVESVEPAPMIEAAALETQAPVIEVATDPELNSKPPVALQEPLQTDSAPVRPALTEAEPQQAPPSNIAPVVDSEAPAQISPAEKTPVAIGIQPAPESKQPSTSPAPQPLVAPASDAAPQNPVLVQAEALLSVIDGKGYTVSHHGDPVGGIPKVSRAMEQVLAMSQDGSIAQMPEGASKQKMQSWAQEIVSARLAQAGNQFDGITESKTQSVNYLLKNPAFASLPADKQHRLLDGLRSGYELMQYAPGEPSEAQLALKQRLDKHFGSPQAAVEIAPLTATKSTAAAQPNQASLAEFEQSLKQKSGLFGGAAKQEKILSQGQALFAAGPDLQLAASQALSDSRHYQELGQLLAKTSAATIAETLTQPTIRGLDVIESADNETAGHLLIALAQHKAEQADAEALIARTLKAFDGIFKDREKPFEILQQSPAFHNLSPDLQGEVLELLKYF